MSSESKPKRWDAETLRFKAAECLEMAASLSPGIDAEQLRLFAAEFAEMIAAIEAAAAVVKR